MTFFSFSNLYFKMNSLRRIFTLNKYLQSRRLCNVHEFNHLNDMNLSVKSLHSISKFSSICSSKSTLPNMSHQSRSLSSLRNHMLVISDEVQSALNNNRPVVALESAIITHGMPHPMNIETAMHLEEILREMNCVPATVGFVEGKLVVGLSPAQIEMIAEPKYETVKISSRDLPIAFAKKKSGGTTVAGTLSACRLAGIPVFVTGGVGGVHRPAKRGEVTWDVSADLTELGRSPGIAVVCAGVKSILDVPATLEYLETQGVTVTVLTEDVVEDQVQFPDFFSRESGVMAPSTVPTVDNAAEMLRAAQLLNLNGALVLAVPTPLEYALSGAKIKEAICESLEEADKRGVRGCAVTPSVLARLAKLTEGTSVSANKGLIANNVKVGGRLALSLAKIKENEENRSSRRRVFQQSSNPEHPVVVVGGSIVDFVATVHEENIELTGRTHFGSVSQSLGGVGRNVADALSHLGVNPLLISAVGDDQHAHTLLTSNQKMATEGIARVAAARTATYCAVIDSKGEALMGVGDMAAHSAITTHRVSQFLPQLEACRLLVLDGNLSQETLEYLLTKAKELRLPVWFEPTDVQKAAKPWAKPALGRSVTFCSPNLNELRAMCAQLKLGEVPPTPKDSASLPSFLRSIVSIVSPMMSPLYELPASTEDESPSSDLSILAPHFEPKAPSGHLRAMMVTLGHLGFMIVRNCPPSQYDSPLMAHCSLKPRTGLSLPVGLFFPPPHYSKIVSVSGAGDCLASGFIAGMLGGLTVSECAAVGNTAARLSLEALPTVPPTLGTECHPQGEKGLSYTLIYP